MEPILETLNDGVVIADGSDQILLVNTVFEEMTGFLIERMFLRNRAICSAEDASPLLPAGSADCEDASCAVNLGLRNTHSPMNTSPANVIFFRGSALHVYGLLLFPTFVSRRG
jgi:hypothetical protein